MKTLKSIMLGLVLLIASVAAKADGKQTAVALSKDNVVDIYTNAAVHGKLDGLDKALAKDVQFNMYRGEKLFQLNKQDVLDSFKANENVEQTCKCTATTLEENSRNIVVKLDMKYDNYVRSNVITLSRSGDGWKITKVEVRTA
jgi:hypothetical protein